MVYKRLIEIPKEMRVILKGLITIGLLVYCFSLVDIESAKLALTNGKPSYFVAAILLVILDTVVGAGRFKLLLDPIFKLGMRCHMAHYFWASFFNTVLPSSIGGDAMRVLWLRRRGLVLRRAFTAIICERLLGILVLLLIIISTLFVYEPPDGLRVLVEIIASVFLAASIVCAGLWFALRNSSRVKTWLGGDLFLDLTSIYRRLLPLTVVSICYQLITIGVSILVAVGVGLELESMAWFVVVPLIWLLTMIPVTIGGFGLREVGFISLLGFYNVDQSYALVVGVLTYLAFLGGGLIGGAWYIFSNR